MIISDLSAGGAQRVVATLANHWASAGHRIVVITLANADADFFSLDPKVDRIVSGGVDVSRSALGAILANVGRIRALRRNLRLAKAPTVVAFVGATNILTVFAALGLGIKVVISERNDPERQSFGGPWDLLRRLVYRYANLVTANSRPALGALSAYVPNKKLCLVRNPVIAPDPPPARLPEPMILSVGRLVHQKAHDILLEAFSRMADQAPDWHLVIIGEGPEEKALRAQASALGVAERTTFTGLTDPWPYYARASVFALPSRHEGTSNALLEAMQMGVTPVVSRSSGGGLELIEDGMNGLVTPAIDPAALSDALCRLTTNPGFRVRLGRAAAQTVSVQTPGAVAAEWESFLQLPSRAQNPGHTLTSEENNEHF